jgi:hypothetical protein
MRTLPLAPTAGRQYVRLPHYGGVSSQSDTWCYAQLRDVVELRPKAAYWSSRYKADIEYAFAPCRYSL